MKEQLYSVSDYAKLCGVVRAAIYLRIKEGTITARKVSNGTDEALVIDAIQFPPQRMRTGRKPFKIN